MIPTTILDPALCNNEDLNPPASSDGVLPPAPPALRPQGPRRGPRPEHYQRISLDGTETRADLRAQGVSDRTIRKALKRGWYTQHYTRPQYPQEDGPGLFATLQNPYGFATAQVWHVLRAQARTDVTPEDVEDLVQEALLWAWERRHCRHITDFPGYISTVIRQKLRQRPWRRA
jgi:hypothetical protein